MTFSTVELTRREAARRDRRATDRPAQNIQSAQMSPYSLRHSAIPNALDAGVRHAIPRPGPSH